MTPRITESTTEPTTVTAFDETRGTMTVVRRPPNVAPPGMGWKPVDHPVPAASFNGIVELYHLVWGDLRHGERDQMRALEWLGAVGIFHKRGPDEAGYRVAPLVAKLVRRFGELRGDLKWAHTLTERLEDKVETLEKIVEERDQRIADLEAQIPVAHAEAAPPQEPSVDVAALRAQLDDARREVKRLNGEVRVHKKLYEDLNLSSAPLHDAAHLSVANDELRAEVARLRAGDMSPPPAALSSTAIIQRMREMKLRWLDAKEPLASGTWGPAPRLWPRLEKLMRAYGDLCICHADDHEKYLNEMEAQADMLAEDVASERLDLKEAAEQEAERSSDATIEPTVEQAA